MGACTQRGRQAGVLGQVHANWSAARAAGPAPGPCTRERTRAVSRAGHRDEQVGAVVNRLAGLAHLREGRQGQGRGAGRVTQVQGCGRAGQCEQPSMGPSRRPSRQAASRRPQRVTAQQAGRPGRQAHHVVQPQVQLVQRQVLLRLAGRLARGVLRGAARSRHGTRVRPAARGAAARRLACWPRRTKHASRGLARQQQRRTTRHSRHARAHPPGRPRCSPARWRQRRGCQSPGPAPPARSTACCPCAPPAGC